MVSPCAKRAASHQLITCLRLSERRACQIVGLPRSTYRRPLAGQAPIDPDVGLRMWLCAYAKAARWGYRRAHADARAAGWAVNHEETRACGGKRAGRVPVGRRRERRGASTGQAPVSAAYRNHVWAINFQVDHLEDGTGFKIASTLDEHTRRILDDTVDVSITGDDVVGILERLSTTHGLPAILRMGNGPELTCQALAEGAEGVSTSRAHRLAPRVQPRPQALNPGLQDPHRIR